MKKVSVSILSILTCIALLYFSINYIGALLSLNKKAIILLIIILIPSITYLIGIFLLWKNPATAKIFIFIAAIYIMGLSLIGVLALLVFVLPWEGGLPIFKKSMLWLLIINAIQVSIFILTNFISIDKSVSE